MKLLEAVQTEDLDEAPICELSLEMNSAPADRVQVPLCFIVDQCCRMNGTFVRYLYPVPSCTPLVSRRNAATVLMSASKQLRWPDKHFSSQEDYDKGNGDKKLHDDIIDFLKTRGLGFSPGCENTSGKEFVGLLQSVLFAVQPHLQKLHGRKKNFIPCYFGPLMEKVYNNPSAHHHKCPPLTQAFLDKLSSSLYVVLDVPWLQKPRWNECASSLKALVLNIDEYRNYLEHQASQQNIRHRSPTPLRCTADGKSTNIHVMKGASVRSADLISRYTLYL